MEALAIYSNSQRSPHTARNAGYRLRAFAAWLDREQGVTDLEQVQTRHVLAYRDALMARQSPSSAARSIETVRAFFRWCREQGYIHTDPAAGVKAPRPVLKAEPLYVDTA